MGHLVFPGQSRWNYGFTPTTLQLGGEMAVQLAEPDHRPLTKAALALVVAQVRFDLTNLVEDRQVARAFYERLGGRDGPFPAISQFRAQQVTFDPASQPGDGVTRVEQRGWRIVAEDQASQVTLAPDALTVETSVFQSWDKFGPVLDSALEALNDEVGPAVCGRVGLRFINVLPVPRSERSTLLRSELLGITVHDNLGDGVEDFESRFTLRLDEGISVLVRSAPAQAESDEDRFVLDVDGSVEPQTPFSKDEVSMTFKTLNDRCLSVFQQLVTPRMLKLLGQGTEK
jgi:uncharacterized protein (TIGR04255 family)